MDGYATDLASTVFFLHDHVIGLDVPRFKLAPWTHGPITNCPPGQLVQGPLVPLGQLVLGPCVPLKMSCPPMSQRL